MSRRAPRRLRPPSAHAMPGRAVMVDVDYRPDQWESAQVVRRLRPDVAAFGVARDWDGRGNHRRVGCVERRGRRRHPADDRDIGGHAQARHQGRDDLSAASSAGRRAAVSGRGLERARRGRCVRQRFLVRVSRRLVARSGRPHGQRLRRHRRYAARLRELHADAGRNRTVRRGERRLGVGVTTRLTMAQAVVRFLALQRTSRDGNEQPLLRRRLRDLRSRQRRRHRRSALRSPARPAVLPRRVTSRRWCTRPPLTRRCRTGCGRSPARRRSVRARPT